MRPIRRFSTCGRRRVRWLLGRIDGGPLLQIAKRVVDLLREEVLFRKVGTAYGAEAETFVCEAIVAEAKDGQHVVSIQSMSSMVLMAFRYFSIRL